MSDSKILCNTYSNHVQTTRKTTLSKETRAELLRKAYILDAKGNYLADFFSAETIRKDQEFRASTV
jgi:hypothetical protein